MSWIAGAAFGGAQGALGLFGALQNNRAVKRSMDSALGATQIGLSQTDDAGELERRRLANEASLVRSRLRVLVGESGFSGNGSFADLDRAVAIDEQLNLAISRRNQFNQRQALVSRLDSQLSQIASQHTTPLFAGFSGAASRFLTGYNIGNLLEDPALAGDPITEAARSSDYLPSDAYPGGYYGGGDFGGRAFT
jgi:hypothetical protein